MANHPLCMVSPKIVVMNQVAHRFNSFVLYFDHHNHVAKNSYKDDIVLNPINTLPKTLSPRKVPRMVGAQLPHFYQNIHRVNSQASGAGNEGDGEGIDDDSEDSDFMNSDNDIEDEDDDLFFDNVDDTVADKGAAHGKKISKGNKMIAASFRQKKQAELQSLEGSPSASS